jgi:hypothetical protein
MQKHLQTLINFLTKNDLKALLQHYLDSSEVENIAQLGFMFQQGQIKSLDYYQQLATAFIENKGFAIGLIAKIKTHDTLNFFTPALQIQGNFNKTDHQQRNVLHYLFTNNQSVAASSQPPFNYLRSMMLFGNNEALRHGLCKREQQNLTPTEAYLFTNESFSRLANHELTALLALIEIESKQQGVDKNNYSHCIKAVSKLCQSQAQEINHELQRIMLIATYYGTSIQQVVSDINTIVAK